MPIEQLREVLKENPDLLKEVEDAYDKAGALEKVKLANADLAKERDELKGREKDLKTQIAAAKAEGVSLADLTALKDELATVQAEIKTAREERERAVTERLASDLKSSVIAAAGKAQKPDQVFALMLAEGLVGTKDGKPFFHKLNDKGEPATAKPDEAVASFLKANPHLEKASGAQGSGQQPKQTGPGGKFNPMDHL